MVTARRRVASRPPILRTVAIGLAGVAVAALVGALSFSISLGDRRPETGEAIGYWTARAKAASALKLLPPDASPTMLARARQLSLQAYAEDATSVEAIRNLGLIADRRGEKPEAARLFAYAEALSRRDFPTQAWLIQNRAAADDVIGALKHYDRALRTSRNARAILPPTLVAASGDARVMSPLADLMAARPPWWRLVAEAMADTAKSPQAIETVIGRLKLDVRDEFERALLGRALQRLVALGGYGQALALFTATPRTGAGGRALVRDGGFQKNAPGIPPFDWQLVDTPGLAGVRQARPGGGAGDIALQIVADRGRGGVVASQLLTLAPGAYRFEGLAGDTQADSLARPSVEVTCAAQGAVPLMSARTLQAGEAGARFAARFAVPAGDCRMQWLAIRSRASFEPLDAAPWIDVLSIRPMDAN